MDRKRIRLPQSSSASGTRRPQKSQKLEPSISPSESSLQADSECQRLKAELRDLHTRLSQNEVAAIKRDKIRKQMEKLLEKERNMLQIQVQEDQVRIDQLLMDLDSARRQTREAREAQIAAEAQLEQFQTTLKMDLNSSALFPSSRYQGNCIMNETNIKSEVDDTMDGQEKLEGYSIPLSVWSCDKMEVKEESYSFDDEGQRTLGLDELPVSADDTISSLERIQQQIPILQERMDDSESQSGEEQIMRPQNDNGSTWSSHGYPSSKSAGSTASKHKISRQQKKLMIPSQKREEWDGDDPSLEPKWSLLFSQFSEWLVDQCESELSESSDDEDFLLESELPDEDESFNLSLEPSAMVSSCSDNRKYRELSVGNDHYVLVSKEFFEIDWRKMYSQRKWGEWSCKECPRVFKSKETVVDHLWVSHNGGRYECPHCHTGSRTFFKVRRSIKNHISKKHPRLC